MEVLFFALQAVVILLAARILDNIRGQRDAISEIRVWLRRLDEDLDSHDRLEVERFQRIEDPADPLDGMSCDGCKFCGTFENHFPCNVCIRREKDYYERLD